MIPKSTDSAQGTGVPAYRRKEAEIWLAMRLEFRLLPRESVWKGLRQPLSVRTPADNALPSAPRWSSCGHGRSVPFGRCGQAARRERQLFANPPRPQNRTSAFLGRHANRRNRNLRTADMPCLPGRSSCALCRPNRAPARTRQRELLCGVAAWRRSERAGNRAACRERIAAGPPQDDAPRRAVARCGYAA